jgi:predicted aldo/keto reductase-like oxidoreductase
MNQCLYFNRRSFIKSSVLGTAGTILGISAAKSQVNPMPENMVIIRRQLGKTDIELPVVSFGVMRSDNAGLVKSAFQMGYSHFDTAHGYQGGNNETMLGDVFKSFPRTSYVIATKVSADDVDRQTGELGPGATKKSLISKFELSLRRLQMNYVDILYLHGISNRNTALAPQMIEALNDLKKQGKVRYVGMSTHKNEPEVIQAAIDSNFYDVVLTAFNFKQDHAEIIKEKIALAAKKGIGIIAMKTMAGAFLDKEKQKPIDCSAALKWVLQDTNVCTAIPGIVTYDQMIENFSVMKNIEFTKEEKANLESARLQAGLYCNGCGLCLNQCRKKLPIDELMRAYMYTFGYRQNADAYAILEDYGIFDNPCDDCDACTVYCVKNFHVAEKIADISRLTRLPENMLV